MQLISENDKMKMINIAINPINEFIKSFFNELKSNINLVDNDIGKNILNINGSWGSGKSTIINNLENYYQCKNNNQKPKFLIFNLWEYETCLNPYDELLKNVFYGIFPHNNDSKSKKKWWKKIWKRNSKINHQLKMINHNIYYTLSHHDFSHTIGYKVTKQITSLNDKIDDWIQKIKNNIKEEIVVIFDDLDRCTSDNQIIFLSYIKNIFFKITNIFFIVSSNNEVINQKLYIENKKEYENKYELENYTDKLFNNIFDINIHFSAEDLTFTENEYIKQFLKESTAL